MKVFLIAKLYFFELARKKGLLGMTLFSAAVCALLLLFLAELALPDPPTRLLPEYHQEVNVHFEEPIAPAALRSELEKMVEDGILRSVYFVGATADDAHIALVGVYGGYRGNAAVSRNALHDMDSGDALIFYIDNVLVPLEYAFRIDELPLYINGNPIACSGMTPAIRFYGETFLPYLSTIQNNSVTIGDQPIQIIFEKSNAYGEHGYSPESDATEVAEAYYLYIPLKQFEKLGLYADCLSVVYEDELTPGRPDLLTPLLDGYDYTYVENAYLRQNESMLTDLTNAIGTSALGVVMLLCILSINELVFIGQTVDNFRSSTKSIHMLGAGYPLQGLVLVMFLLLVYGVGYCASLAAYAPLRHLLTCIGYAPFSVSTNIMTASIGFFALTFVCVSYYTAKMLIIERGITR